MEKSRLETKVGLFVLIGLGLLAVILLQFSKSTSLWRGTYELHLHAANVGGIKPRAGVLLAGVQVGSVADIRLAPDGKSVTIDLKIYNEFPIYTNSTFVIESAGFLGDQFVSIIPSTNLVAMTAADQFTNGANALCLPPFNLLQVARDAGGFINRIDDTAKELDESVKDLRAKVLNAETLSSFGTSMTNLKLFTEQALDTIKDINGLVSTNGAQVSLAVSNAVQFSAGLTDLTDSAKQILATNSVNLNQATKDLAAAMKNVKQLTDDVQAGKGLAGAVLQNPELATNVQAIAANLAVTSSNLNRLGLWGILWSHPPPATNTGKNATLASPHNRP
jgi:phospholipid/cholesterol/gamma-HCH transport system substrate-binding protein